MSTGTITKDNVALRQSAGSAAASIAALSKGTRVDGIVDDLQDGVTWWFVSTRVGAETRVGWVQGTFVAFDASVQSGKPPTSMPDWSRTPQLGSSPFHDRGGLRWRFDGDGVFTDDAPHRARRSQGPPITCSQILALYGPQIFDASMRHEVPPELIVMTIAAESGAERKARFTGPTTFRWEPKHRTYSAGPMQILATTAREVIGNLHLDHDAEAVARAFAAEPHPSPISLPLYDAGTSIDVGTGYIKLNRMSFDTGFDPILVAACYNAGSLRTSDDNPWGLFTYGGHLDRAADWAGDACSILGRLRKGGVLDGDAVRSDPETSPGASDPGSFVITGLLDEDADREVDFFMDAGATARKRQGPDRLFSVEVTFPDGLLSAPPSEAGEEGAPAGPDPLQGAFAPPPQGFALCIDRVRTEVRQGMGYARTVGVYQTFFDGVAIPGLCGMVCERRTPGDNTAVGKREHLGIAAGTYPLFTHGDDSGKYRTLGYTTSNGIGAVARPALRVGNTDRRDGILIHPAQGYLWSTGCLNLSSTLKDANSNIVYADSRRRVIDIIEAMARLLGDDFPRGNNRVVAAKLVVRDGRA